MPLREYRNWKTGFLRSLSEHPSNVPVYGEVCKDLGKVLLGFSLLKYQKWHLLMAEDSKGITEEGVIEHRAESR